MRLNLSIHMVSIPRMTLVIGTWGLFLSASFATKPEAPVPMSSPEAPSQTVTSSKESAVADELTPWSMTRFEKMIRKSPFAPATAAPAPVAAPGFAVNLYLSGLAKIGDRDFASISSRDQTTKFSLFTGETNSDGIQLVSVQWADSVGRSKVTVKKGTEFGILEYDQAVVQKTPQVAVPNVPAAGFTPPQPARPIILPGGQNQPGVAQPVIPTRRRTIIRNQP